MPIAPDGTPLPYANEQIPPELAALLGGGQAEPEEPEDGPSILRQILDLAARYAQVEDDDQDLLQIEKARTLIQQLLAAQQKEMDDALGLAQNNKVLRRLG